MTFVLSVSEPSKSESDVCQLNTDVYKLLQKHLLNKISDIKMELEDLLIAIVQNDLDTVAKFLATQQFEHNLKLVQANYGTLLHFSVLQSNVSVEMVQLIVMSNVADLDMFDREQNTALMLAVSDREKVEIARYLVTCGASSTLKGTDGMTPLHLAAKCGNLPSCQLLLEHHTTNIRNYINGQDDGGWTPLVWACENGFSDVVTYLMTKGADYQLRDVEHNLALHWSAFSGSNTIIEMLLSLKRNEVNAVNAHGDTPLHISSRENKYSSVVLLLIRGADVTIINKNNETPMDCAIEDSECYKILSLNYEIATKLPQFRARKCLLNNDISRGRELNPIQCINEFDDDPAPNEFVYITRNCITTDNVRIDMKLTNVAHCNCLTKRCLMSDECQCGKMSVRPWYDEEGKLISDFSFTDSPLIFECNDTCLCNTITCTNRVVQKGLTQRFQLFKTSTNKGWGIKTLRQIPKGSFVCEYIGEILTDFEADQRDDDSYLFDLDNKEVESFCIDARFYGNFARFINHSCDPNLHSVKVFVEHHDLRFPRIALFAQRDIAADEELSFDYGHKFWLVKYKSFTCCCGATTCKYSVDNIQNTLEHLLE